MLGAATRAHVPRFKQALPLCVRSSQSPPLCITEPHNRVSGAQGRCYEPICQMRYPRFRESERSICSRSRAPDLVIIIILKNSQKLTIIKSLALS